MGRNQEFYPRHRDLTKLLAVREEMPYRLRETQLYKSVVPKLFGSRDGFQGRCYFHGQGEGVDRRVLGWFKNAHNLDPSLVQFTIGFELFESLFCF